MMTQMTSYAIVTGGNRGLGLDLCRKLVLLGKPVILTARSTEAGKAAADSLDNSLCRFYQLDTSDTSSIEAFAHALAKDLPGQQIDLLINNAAVILNDWTKENFDGTIKTNVTGPVSLIRALEPLLKDGAMVINVSSSVGQRVWIKDQDYIKIIHDASSVQELCSGLNFEEDSLQKEHFTGSYSVSKAALSKATTLMSEEPALKERRISLISVNPGWCRTPMGYTGTTHLAKQNIIEEPPRSTVEGAESILRPFTNFKTEYNGAFLDEFGEQFNDCV